LTNSTETETDTLSYRFNRVFPAGANLGYYRSQHTPNASLHYLDKSSQLYNNWVTR